jgi:hypothetical protein
MFSSRYDNTLSRSPCYLTAAQRHGVIRSLCSVLANEDNFMKRGDCCGQAEKAIDHVHDAKIGREDDGVQVKRNSSETGMPNS